MTSTSYWRNTESGRGGVSRRELLELGAATFACLWGTPMNAQQAVPAVEAVDHLLLGIDDLDKGVAWVEKLTGIRAVAGGSHPGVGTRNALLSLGGRRYLEIIAPDPAQSNVSFRHDVRKIAEPRLITWAAVTTDIDGLAKRIAGQGQQVFARDGSRARPDGKMLKWRTLAMMHDLGSETLDPIPFFIQWAEGSVHPSQDSPTGCTLESFGIEHGAPERLAERLNRLGLQVTVKASQAPRLVATLDTPKGRVVLS